jgi:hypothetical protein
VREKFVYATKMGNDMKFVRPSNFGQKAEFVYIKLDAIPPRSSMISMNRVMSNE